VHAHVQHTASCRHDLGCDGSGHWHAEGILSVSLAPSPGSADIAARGSNEEGGNEKERGHHFAAAVNRATLSRPLAK
jgi:hypothetical protein